MKKIVIILMLLVLVLQWGCKRYAEDYKDYRGDKEIIYPGLARNVHYRAGNLRTKLVWNPSPDPNISHYFIQWNNGSQSISVQADAHNPIDSMAVIIPDLPEYVYSFTLTAVDSKGNQSIGQQVHNVRVYGPSYQAVLLNRLPDPTSPFELTPDQEVRIKFSHADSMNVTTRVSYMMNTGSRQTLYLAAEENELILPNYQYGTSIQYRSGYLPEQWAVDTLYTLQDAQFPTVLRPINSSNFQPLFLPGDGVSAWGWLLPYLWDNRLDEPGFHTTDLDIPASFSIDMGKPQSVAKIKLWQRISAAYNYGNPKTFEIYGSNKLSEDGNWESWNKLGTFTMEKPSGLPLGENSEEDIRVGQSGHEFSLDQAGEPFRYLRVRVLETWGKTPYMHLIELTLFSNK